MTLFHRHRWLLIDRIYAPPIGSVTLPPSIHFQKTLERLTMGLTTLIFQCRDESCSAIRREECLGQPVPLAETEEHMLP